MQGNVVDAGTNELVTPNHKQTWGIVRKIADRPVVTNHVTFKSHEYKTG